MGSEFDDVVITNWRTGSIWLKVDDTKVIDGRRRLIIDIHDTADSPSTETYFNGDSMIFRLSEKKKGGVS
jgi:hypothetical protein